MPNWDDELNSVIRQVESLKGLPKLTAKRAAKKIEDLIQSQFNDGRDPYGNAWEPLADGSASHLDDTGAMRGSLSVEAVGGVIEASLDDPFPYHQAGTARMPARPVLPFAEIPESWEDAIDEAVDEELQAYEIFSGSA